MDGHVVKLIDQRVLPGDFAFFEGRSYEDVARAIEQMVVRGAPAIGATAAYAMAQAAVQGHDRRKVVQRLRRTRPTGYDLHYATDYMLHALDGGRDPVKAAEGYAKAIEERCLAIGRHGEGLIRDGMRILTHCNAGALATVDYGTATAPMYRAHAANRPFFVYVDETRPRLQGAKLTAWELDQAGIDHAIIADNAAGLLMQRGEIDMVLVGADRVCANGDVANKIGTYEKAVLAKEHGIPFYVAAPSTTVDFSLKDGTGIPIEERDDEEVLTMDGRPIAPAGSKARNPSFDMTPARYVTGYITEKGVLKARELKGLRDAG
jgi:translation initiation factor eIF-2B subunit alpha/methylthioribose-1-phosphate isomerase